MSINFKNLNSVQKSAILLISLGVENASKVFNNLSQNDVEKLTIATAKLKDIPSEVVNEVIKEYYDMMVAKNYVEEGGMGYASSVLEAAMGKEDADSLLRKINASKETTKSVFNDKISSLPKNLNEAIILFEEDKDLAEVFSQKFVRTIAAIRRVEYNAYLKVVSSWEREFLLLNV